MANIDFDHLKAYKAPKIQEIKAGLDYTILQQSGLRTEDALESDPFNP